MTGRGSGESGGIDMMNDDWPQENCQLKRQEIDEKGVYKASYEVPFT